MLTEYRLRIAWLRQQRGWSQPVLAKKAGLSLGYLGRLEMGWHDPSLSTLEKLATALRVTLPELLAATPHKEGYPMTQEQQAALAKDTLDRYTTDKGLRVLCTWAELITEENAKEFDRERMLAALVARLRKGAK